MKFKTSAIAMAVAGTIAAPIAQADGDIYASARVGIHSIDNDDARQNGVDGGEVIVQSYGSRFGAVGETDLGNGMTGFGQFESQFSNEGEITGGRKLFVGVKGDFGAVQLGKDYQVFYDHVVGPLDNPWAGSGYAMVAYVGRNSNMIRYDGSAGAVTWGVGLEMNPGEDNDFTTPGDESDAEDVDAIEVGVSFGLGDMTIGIAARDVDTEDNDPDAVIGIALSGIQLGDASIGISFQSQEDDTGVVLDVGLAGFYFHVEAADFDEDSETAGSIEGLGTDGRADTAPTAVTVGYTMGLGRNTTAWFEAMSVDHDSDNSDVDDQTHVRAVLKYDIL